MLFDNSEDYFVDDIVKNDTKYIFILESPHTDELKYTYPVAGSSGVSMSRVLFNKDESFGSLVKNNIIKNIGILNVSNYPLQSSAYPETIMKKNIELFENLRKIRANPKKRKKDIDINSLIKSIEDDFCKRLSSCKEKNIIICGNFAKTVFENNFSYSDFNNVLNVPHPSFNNWNKDKYKQNILKLKRFLKK